MSGFSASHLGVAGLAMVMTLLGNAPRLGFHACPEDGRAQGHAGPAGLMLQLSPCAQMPDVRPATG